MTPEIARRLIRSQLQYDICNEKLRDGCDIVWESLQWLAKTHLETNYKEWYNHARNLDRETIVRVAKSVLHEATLEAGRPYSNRVSQSWLERLREKFETSFDPESLIPLIGEA